MKNDFIFLLLFLASILPCFTVAPSDFLPEMAPASIRSNTKQLNFIFTLWHTTVYDYDRWQALSKQFSDLIVLCQKSDKDKLDDRWISMLGAPFEGIMGAARGKQGIHANVFINVADEIHFEVILIHDHDYDVLAWAEVIKISQEFVGNGLGESKNDAWMQKFAPLFSEVISSCGDASGIHGTIELKVS